MKLTPISDKQSTEKILDSSNFSVQLFFHERKCGINRGQPIFYRWRAHPLPGRDWMIRSCLYPSDVGCKYTIKWQNESPWKAAFSYSKVSGELLHLQAGGLLPLRKPFFHAASCFVFECALTPPVSLGTQATTFSLHILSSSHYQRIIQRHVTKTDNAQLNK